MNSSNLEDLGARLSVLCKIRKYKCKANKWIGLGSLQQGDRLIDMVVFLNNRWKYDPETEAIIQKYFNKIEN